MNCTCPDAIARIDPDCPRHGWPEEREIDPALQDRLDRAEAIGVVVMACLIAAILLAAIGFGLHGFVRFMGWAE